MPRVDKEALSQFIRTECRRQLRLNLHPNTAAFRHEREAADMPPPQPPRPGLEQFTQAGEAWQTAKLDDLSRTLGETAVVGNRAPGGTSTREYRTANLDDLLPSAVPSTFLVEAGFAIGPAFLRALGIDGHQTDLGLVFSQVRPDLIAVLPARRDHEAVGEDGRPRFAEAVRPDGETERLAPDDDRLRLRIIDIKLTAEPSPSYFAEVTYYAMALAGWLLDHELADRFVVVQEGAVWPGSHDASHLAITAAAARARGEILTTAALLAALEEDLEAVPFAVFVPRVRRFLQQDVPDVLATPWQELPWHVDNRCKGCENLGYPWQRRDGTPTNHPGHCWPSAEAVNHLSRVAFISRGAGLALTAQGVGDVAALAARSPEDAAFDAHQTLRATRTVIAHRAASLGTGLAEVPPAAGSSAVMPRWADLRVYLSADFDIGSAITVAFGVKAFWLEPRPFDAPDTGDRQTQVWKPRAFFVDLKDLKAEERELLAFLDHLHHILSQARQLNANTTVQLYLWDDLQYDHLCRVVGRHLQAILDNDAVAHLAWLFPPEEILPNPDLIVRKSPLTIVQGVVRAVLAAPIPHYYGLLTTARAYHPADAGRPAPEFSVHPLFEDALSDQIPSERAHEIWTRTTTGPRSWIQQLQTLQETIERRLAALEAVAKRLEADLRPVLNQTAPAIAKLAPPTLQSAISSDGQLWHGFARLDAAIAELENATIRAMPPHERTARFESARFARRLHGDEERAALAIQELQPRPGRRVYELRRDSYEARFKEGDFTCALAPAETSGFLDRPLAALVRGTPLESTFGGRWEKMERVARAAVVAFDRNNGIAVLDPEDAPTINALEAAGVADLATDAILDPVAVDFFAKPLLRALKAIGNPAIAVQTSLIERVRRATGQSTRTGKRGPRQTNHTPPADLLWNAAALHAATIARDLAPVRDELRRAGFDLNATQWDAWTEALSRRLTLIWGPPGTGKSRTLRTVVLGAVLAAHQAKTPLRLLITAATHTAIDNVLLPLPDDLTKVLPCAGGPIAVARLRSSSRPLEANVPASIDIDVNRRHPSETLLRLETRLLERTGISIVGATPHQAHNLLILSDESAAQRELFDLILIDEASQMDVPHAILPLCGLAAGGSVVLAGDPKQLPPIHQAEPPKGLEAMVGSIYEFMEQVHKVEPTMLDVNYRSNATIVRLAHRAGYKDDLTAHSPDLRLNLIRRLPTERPPVWPGGLPWSPEWAALLDPDRPAVCFVYDEGQSSQWNRFEADAIAALVRLLYGKLGADLRNERDHISGRLKSPSPRDRSWDAFWGAGIGVVTPHRAQQGLIVRRLSDAFADSLGSGKSAEAIRDAVDTVERFQGQERDVILASFALGDPDAIAAEDEFLLSLNRFNVMASRPRAKLVVLVSREVVAHLSSDLATLRGSALLKTFVESFCACSREMALPYVLENGEERIVPGLLRWAP